MLDICGGPGYGSVCNFTEIRLDVWYFSGNFEKLTFIELLLVNLETLEHLKDLRNMKTRSLSIPPENIEVIEREQWYEMAKQLMHETKSDWIESCNIEANDVDTFGGITA